MFALEVSSHRTGHKYLQPVVAVPNRLTWSCMPLVPADFGENPFRRAILQEATLKWCDTRHWRSVTDVTLSLKYRHWSKRGSIPVDQTRAERNFAFFMRLLNRRVYRAAYRRHGMKLRVIAVLEKAEFGRYHIHAAVEPPAHLDHEQFEAVIRDCWLETDWGYDEGLVRPNADAGWIDYMLKLRQKQGLEQWSDCLLGTFHNPIDERISAP